MSMKKSSVCRFELQVFNCGIVRINKPFIAEMRKKIIFLNDGLYVGRYMLKMNRIQTADQFIQNTAKRRT